MSQFADKDGTLWTVAIDILTVRDVRNELGLNLVDFIQEHGSQLCDRLADAETLASVIYVVCRPQVTLRGLDQDSFIRSFDCDAINAATAALLEALSNFYPQTKRKVMRAILTQATQRIAATQPTDEEIEKSVAAAMDRHFQTTTGDKSGELQASLASTPAA